MFCMFNSLVQKSVTSSPGAAVGTKSLAFQRHVKEELTDRPRDRCPGSFGGIQAASGLFVLKHHAAKTIEI